MTDLEINEAVARKLGNTEWTSGADGYKTIDELTNEEKCYMVPDYCHDIKAAWEIVERQKHNGFMMCLDNVDGFWVCSFSSNKSLLKNAVQADTAPMAICKAILGFDYPSKPADPRSLTNKFDQS